MVDDFAEQTMETKGENSVTFNVGDNVFARVKGHPAWPAVVHTIQEDSQKRKKYEVHFYGSSQKAVCKGDALYPYELSKDKFGSRSKRSKDFNRALDLIAEAAVNEHKTKEIISHKSSKIDVDEDRNNVTDVNDSEREQTVLPDEEYDRAANKDDSKNDKMSMQSNSEVEASNTDLNTARADLSCKSTVENVQKNADADINTAPDNNTNTAVETSTESKFTTINNGSDDLSGHDKISQNSVALGKRAIEDKGDNKIQQKRSRLKSGSPSDLERDESSISVSDEVVEKASSSKEGNSFNDNVKAAVKKRQRKKTKSAMYSAKPFKAKILSGPDSRMRRGRETEADLKQKEQKEKETTDSTEVSKSLKTNKRQNTKNDAKGAKKPKIVKAKKAEERDVRDYQRGDKVFAKVRGYSPWPAVISAPAGNKPPYLKYHVSFYGTQQTGVCKVADIIPYEIFKNTHGIPKNRSQAFRRALSDIKKASG